ncbi:hypothetical protein N3553_25790, partial [Pantoea dispersa]|nr:hypothetical protein [Pantoea dispersa]
VMRNRMKKTGYVTRALCEKLFWQKGVRGVMVSTRSLYAKGEGFVWVIFSSVAVGGSCSTSLQPRGGASGLSPAWRP